MEHLKLLMFTDNVRNGLETSRVSNYVFPVRNILLFSWSKQAYVLLGFKGGGTS